LFRIAEWLIVVTTASEKALSRFSVIYLKVECRLEHSGRKIKVNN